MKQAAGKIHRSARRRELSRDRSVPEKGLVKSARIDLGLELLALARKPGAMFSLQEIAMWCGCTNEALRQVEAGALKKLGNAMQFGRARRVGEELRAS